MICYTAITGRVDYPRHTGRLTEEPFVMFTDLDPYKKPMPYRYLGWELRRVTTQGSTPRLCAKMHQILPHRFFETDLSLYLDGTHIPICRGPIEVWARSILGDSDLAVFRHPTRTTSAEEADMVLQMGLDQPDVVTAQQERYRSAGFHDQVPLCALTVILRRHTSAVEAFNEAWWDEIEHGSIRDQLSFPYVAWKTGVKLAWFPGHPYFNGAFHYVPHGWMWSEHGVHVLTEEVKRAAGC